MPPTMGRDTFNQQSLGLPLNTMVKEVGFCAPVAFHSLGIESQTQLSSTGPMRSSPLC